MKWLSPGRLLGLLAFAGVLGVARPAAAQRTGFALDRFEPAERGSQFFTNDTLDLRGDLRPAFGATLAHAYKPLAVYDEDGIERSAIVNHQVFTHLGGVLVLGDRVRLGLNLPVAVYQDGDTTRLDGETLVAPSKPAVGDLRLAVDVRLFGAHGDALTLAGGLRTWVPTGQRAQFTGDGSTRLGPQLLAAGTLGLASYAARLSVIYRARDDDYAGSPLGSEIAGSLAAGLRTANGKLVVGPELSASTVFTDAYALLSARGTPAEWMFGAHYDALGVRIAAGVGAGLSRGFGTSQLRTVLAIEYAPPFAKPVVIPALEPEQERGPEPSLPPPTEANPAAKPTPDPTMADPMDFQ